LLIDSNLHYFFNILIDNLLIVWSER